MSRKTYLFSTGIHIIHMIDTKKFDFHHYAKKYFFTAHDSKKRAATLNRRAATVKGGQPRFTEKIRAVSPAGVPLRYLSRVRMVPKGVQVNVRH